MAAKAGRALRIKYGATVIAGARTDSFTINAEGIDVTDKDDAGIRTMLAEPGTWFIDYSGDGVLKDDTLLALAADSTRSTLLDFEIDVAGLGTFAPASAEDGWFMSSFEASGAEGTDPTTFSFSLQSSGDITYTAA